MQAFAHLLDGLVYTQSRNRKIALLGRYFRETRDPDRGWAMAALTDGVPLKIPVRRMLADLTVSFIDPVLYNLSRDYVGDTAETVALLWPAFPRTPALPGQGQGEDPPIVLTCCRPSPPPSPHERADHGEREDPSLDAVIAAMRDGTLAEKTARLGAILDRLDASGRWACLKLIGGAPRVGVSARLAKTAIAKAFNRDVAEIEELWHALDAPYLELFAWLEGRAAKPDAAGKPVFRPVMLAHPVEDTDWPKLAPQDFVAEWKWDGIRVQIAVHADDVRIFSRQGDDISPAFPELKSAFANHTCVADGELLVLRNGAVAPFNDLQQRLNRKTVTAKLLRDYPAHVRLYDLLFETADDLRTWPFDDRRARLETWHAREHPALTSLSELVPFQTFEDLKALWSSARDDGIEGLMLKRRASSYQAGRIAGQWFKWKRAPLTLDCVLMYAQRGSGKRSSFYSDYTFGVWRTKEDGARDLVPIGKAYSGFTDEDLRELDKYIRTNTTESFGPVRAVAPNLVFEVAFDAIQLSKRHKSGVAMRFPRISRIRWDKPARDADTLETAKALLGKG